jgi:integrase
MMNRIDRPDPYRTRDRAVILFGFATALRRTNIISARIEHIRFTPQGMIVRVPREKQDQTGVGRDIGVPFASDAAVCAARATRDWLHVRGTEPGYLFDGLWHGQLRPGARMHHNTIAAIVKRAAESIGLDPAHYAGHSLRSGLATAALESGAGEILTARHTGHRSLQCLRMYLRGNDPFAGNVLGVIGL